MAPRPRSLILVATWLATCAIATLACAQVQGGAVVRAEPSPRGVQLPSQIDLARLIDLCAQELGTSIEYDPTSVQGLVTLRSPGLLTPEDLWSLANRQLIQRGLTTVRQPGSDALSVVRLEGAAGVARIEEQGVVAVPRAGFETIVLTSLHRTARELAEHARTAVSRQTGVVTLAGGDASGDGRGLVLVSDTVPRLEQVRMLVATFDTPQPAASIEEVQVQHVAAMTLAAMVRDLHTKQEAATGTRVNGDVIVSPTGRSLLVLAERAVLPYWLDLIARLDRPEASATRTYHVRSFRTEHVAELVERSIAQGDGDRAASPIRVVIDERTSSLFITARPSEHDAIQRLLSQLELDQPQARPVRSFRIKNRSVDDVVATLTKLLDAGVFAPAPGGTRENVAGAASQRSDRAVGTPGSNALRSTLGQVERSPAPPTSPSREGDGDALSATPQLRLTADSATNTLVAVGDEAVLTQLEALLPELDVRQPQVMLDVMLISLSDGESRNLGVELERLGRIDGTAYRVASLFGLSTAGAAGRTVADGAGFTGAVLNPGEFSVVVRALETINKGRTQSKPRLLVTNNEQATFSSVVQQPFTSAVSSSGGTAQGFGGTEDAGTTIAVRPQIAQGDHLVLTYSIKLSSFVGSPTAPGLPPPKQQNAVDSIATIPDGHTVVVGGLELLTNADGSRQVPVLGAIPLLGNLFKSQSEDLSMSRFYVFIRANILRNAGFEDLRLMSGDVGAAIDMGDGFPVLEPQVMP